MSCSSAAAALPLSLPRKAASSTGIQKAKAGDFDGARKCIEEGQKLFLVGHEAHFELIQKEAQGVEVGGSLILVHAEDQLMSAESFRILAEEFIELYKRMDEK